jgi:cytochrome c2
VSYQLNFGIDRGANLDPPNALSSRLGRMLKDTSNNLQSWIQHPRKVNPHTAMLEQGVTDQDGPDMPAYLYTAR